MKKYGKNFTHFSRGTIQSVDGHSFLCLGGARYMDIINTPMHSEISDHDINLCLSHPENSIKIILSHDCPSGIGVANTPGLEFYGIPGIARSGELLHHYSPLLWIFGHHHKWFSKKSGNTLFHGLAESWNGFGILEDNGTFTTFKNTVEKSHESFWKRWFGGF
jgi:Icc-related predicted phosphoesterase